MTDFAPTAIFVIGSINTDMVVKTESLPAPGQTVLGGDFLMTPGGKGANQAVAAARLGGNVSMVGMLGQDLFAEQSVSKLLAEGIDCEHVLNDQQQASGVALISVDNRGENQIVVAPGANELLNTDRVDAALEKLPEQAVILLQLEIPLTTVAHVLATTSKRNCRVILDPAPAQKLPAAVLQDLFLITPNESEAEILTGIRVTDESTAVAASTALLAQGVENIALTMGAQGVLLASQTEHKLVPALAVDAEDTTAAGDCFNGALAAALSRGASLSAAVEFACRAAARSVTRRGAQISMPTREEIQWDD